MRALKEPKLAVLRQAVKPDRLNPNCLHEEASAYETPPVSREPPGSSCRRLDLRPVHGDGDCGAAAAARGARELPAHIEILQPGVNLTLLAEHPRPGHADRHRCRRPGEHLAGRVPHPLPALELRGSGARRDSRLRSRRQEPARVLQQDRLPRCKSSSAPTAGSIWRSAIAFCGCEDTDGDGVGDAEENLATLDTAADYPHNGLAGMAWHPDGDLLFSLGENCRQGMDTHRPRWPAS